MPSFTDANGDPLYPTGELVEAAEVAKSWLDEQATRYFHEYCDIFKIWRGYYIESIEMQVDRIRIQIDAGHGNTDIHYLPLAPFYSHTRLKDLRDLYNIEQATKAWREATEHQIKIEKARKWLAELEEQVKDK